MNAWIKKAVLAGLVGTAGALAGCSDRSATDERGTGGAATEGEYVAPAEPIGQERGAQPVEPLEGTGGSGMDQNPNEVGNTEGPLEGTERDPGMEMGTEEGVMNDGEGPLEQNPGTGGSGTSGTTGEFGNTEGPLEGTEQDPGMEMGQNDGVINDGEGPSEGKAE